MATTPNRYHDWLRVGATTILFLLALPVVAALVFVGRFVLAGLAIAALVIGAVLCGTSPRFREWLSAVASDEITYKGLRLATRVAVAPVHSWARTEPNGVVVGSDDLAPTVLGPIGAVELPNVGQRLRQGEPLVHLRRGGRSIVLRAPVSGTVIERNETLHTCPYLVNEAPYSDGWMVRLQSDASRTERPWLQRGKAARSWFRDEVDRLVVTLKDQEDAICAMADGGPLIEQLHREIDEAAWKQITRTFFGGGDKTARADS